MNTFDENASCPKCGGKFITTKYRGGEYPRLHDLICRSCQRCGYLWFERPLDAPTVDIQQAFGSEERE